MFRITVVICLIVLLFPAIATAEKLTFHKGTELVHNGRTVILDRTHFLVPRDWVDKANATAAADKKLQQSLIDCQKSLAAERHEEDSSSLISALKWTGVGLAIAGAFYFGTTVR